MLLVNTLIFPKVVTGQSDMTLFKIIGNEYGLGLALLNKLQP